MSFSLSKYIERRWYTTAGPLWVLFPLSVLFQLIAKLTKHNHLKKTEKLGVPVCIIGNISVGGTGKTPTIIALVNALKTEGIRAGVISRGYGSSLEKGQVLVLDSNANAITAGDEPYLIYKRCKCPVAISTNRTSAAKALIAEGNVDVLLSDDGMQHYQLTRQLEVALLDGDRLLGNQQLMPVGPLRETSSRLESVDWILLNGGSASKWNNVLKQLTRKHTLPEHYCASLDCTQAVNLKTGQAQPLSHFSSNASITAMAGIGNPDRFFATLKQHSIYPSQLLALQDHYEFKREDFTSQKDSLILMTEKDAVKCEAFATENMWYVPVDLQLPTAFTSAFLKKVKQLIHHH